MLAKELRAQRATIINQSREFLDKVEKEGRDFNAEEVKAWDKFNADIDALGKRIERIEVTEKREADLKAILDPANLRGKAPGSAVGDLPEEKPEAIPYNEARALAIQGWVIRNSSDDGRREQLTDRHAQA